MPSNLDKWRFSLISTVIFLLVISPMTYKLTQSLLGSFLGKIADAQGNPTWRGIVLHAVVFTLIVRLSMDVIR
jgi:hypothetical protein